MIDMQFDIEAYECYNQRMMCELGIYPPKKPKKGKNQRQKRKFNRQNPHSKKYRK